MGKRKAHQMSDGDSDEEERSLVAEAPKRKKSKTKLNANESNALISPESLLETADEVWIVKVPKHVSFFLQSICNCQSPKMSRISNIRSVSVGLKYEIWPFFL